MVRFNDVVQILDLPVQRLLGASALLLQLGQSGGVGRRLVGVDDPRLLPVLQAAQRLAEKALRRRRAAGRGEVEVDSVPMLVDGPVEIGPLAADLHVGLVDAPAGRARPAPLPTQPFLDLGRVFLNPAVNRRMVDRDAALAHHLLEIMIAHPVAAIPPDRPEHYLTLKVAPLEVRHGPLPSLALDPSRRKTVGFATEPNSELTAPDGRSSPDATPRSPRASPTPSGCRGRAARPRTPASSPPGTGLSGSCDGGARYACTASANHRPRCWRQVHHPTPATYPCRTLPICAPTP